MAFQYIENGLVHFVASNAGERPGTVGEVYFDAGSRRGRTFLKADQGNRYIPAGASRQLTFRLLCGGEISSTVIYSKDPVFGGRPYAKDGRLFAVTTQFDGSQNTQSWEIGELSGAMALSDAAHRCLHDAVDGDLSKPHQ